MIFDTILSHLCSHLISTVNIVHKVQKFNISTSCTSTQQLKHPISPLNSKRLDVNKLKVKAERNFFSHPCDNIKPDTFINISHTKALVVFVSNTKSVTV